MHVINSIAEATLIYWVDVETVNQRIGIHYVRDMRLRPIQLKFNNKPHYFEENFNRYSFN